MRLLIVDDEQFTRDGLYRLIQDSHLPFDDIQVARNGDRAVAFVRESMPEVILCDIRMPGMNGLELAKTVKSVHPQCQIVFMSGFNDREYIKTALDIKAVAFIDKPIDGEELLEILERAVTASIQTERDRYALHNLNSEETANIILESRITDDMLSGGLASVEGWVFRCLLVSSPLPRRKLIIGILQELGIWGVCTADSGTNSDVVFFKHRSDKVCGHIYNKLLDSDTAVRLAVGSAVKSAGELASSYKSAVYVLDSLFYHTSSRMAYSGGNQGGALNMTPTPAQFAVALESGTEQAFAYLEGLRNDLLEHPCTPISLVKAHYYEMLYHVISTYGEGPEKPDSRTVWERCLNAASLQDLETLIWNALSAATKEDSEQAVPHTVRITRKYIGDNFKNSLLTIHDIARDVHTSPGHLSAIFKKHTKYTLLQYITHCRIEYAKERLVQSNDRLLKVARETGYNDPYYFGKVFQRETGMSPQQYRITMYRE